MNEKVSILCMYAVTPCHAGSGSSLGVVDNPIQRERHTNWPVIHASGMKGSMRANFDRHKKIISEIEQKQLAELTENIFGSDKGGTSNSGFAGSLSISDVRILAYPMRSSIAPFVWVTCPAVLKRFARDLEFAGKITNAIDFTNMDKTVKTDEEKSNAITLLGSMAGSLLLEDCEVETSMNEKIKENLTQLMEYIKKAERLILVPDDIFDYAVTDCTQILPQIAIDQKTGTTKDGSLRYQEELPSDTIMYCIIHWGDTRNSLEAKIQAETVKSYVTEQVIAKHIQVGGDETLGRGIFELDWK